MPPYHHSRPDTSVATSPRAGSDKSHYVRSQWWSKTGSTGRIYIQPQAQPIPHFFLIPIGLEGVLRHTEPQATGPGSFTPTPSFFSLLQLLLSHLLGPSIYVLVVRLMPRRRNPRKKPAQVLEVDWRSLGKKDSCALSTPQRWHRSGGADSSEHMSSLVS